MVGRIRKRFIGALLGRNRVNGGVGDADARKQMLARLERCVSEYEKLNEQIEQRDVHGAVTVWPATRTIS